MNATKKPARLVAGAPPEHCSTPAIAFSELIRVRLAALIERRGSTLTGEAKAMQKSHTWLRRKLDPSNHNPRPLTTVDVDEILAHLGEPSTAIMAPVLLAGDREVLILLRNASKRVTLGELGELVQDVETISRRLQDQGLIVVDPRLKTARLTDLAVRTIE